MAKGNITIRFIRYWIAKGRRAMRKWFVEPFILRSFGEYGHNVRIPRGCTFSGCANIFVGSDVFFGIDTLILTQDACLRIGSHVMFGPRVSIITGDHRTDVFGKYMCDVTVADKHPHNDQDVVIEDDVWIGANSTILKGVTIGRGSVIAAGALVTKSCPPYSIIGGVPAKLLKTRFTPEQIEQHEALLAQKHNGGSRKDMSV